MKTENVAAVGVAGAGIAAVVLKAESAKEWVAVASEIVGSPVSTLLLLLVVLMMLGWLSYRLYHKNDSCEDRIAALMDAMRTLHTMLSGDDRYAEQLPPWEEFIAKSVDAKKFAKANRHAASEPPVRGY